jgi:hypothetical protein
LTAQQLAARTNDPRGNPNNLQFDPAFAAETDRLYQQAYPDSSSANPTNPKQPASVADQVPAEASGYRLGESEKLAPFAKQLEGDELWGTARKLARDAGLSQKQFAGFVTPVLEMIAERDGGSVNYQAELKKLTPADALHLDEHGQRASAGRRVQAALSFLEQDAVAAGLDPQLAEFVIEQLGESERGIRAIEFFRSRLGGNR